MDEKIPLTPLPSNIHVCTYECVDEEISLCKDGCYCATKTIHGKCGKCKAPKPKEDKSGSTEAS